MLFNSFAFIGFFAIVAIVYYALPHRWRWPLLLLLSYYFYSTFDPGYLLLLGFATTVAYLFGRTLAAPERQHRGLLLATGILLELSVLIAFKYVDFVAGTLNDGFALGLPRLGFLLPAGLSFYTFSCASYIVDAYRGTIPAERHIGKLALYVAYFPKLLAGPIERAGSFLAQLETPIRYDAAMVAAGIQLAVWGLFKKVVIADRLAHFVDAGFTNPDFQSPVTILISVYFYAFQIYCDFSGYSDIAIGTSAILGINLMENFRRPYLSRSVPEFWNTRWHLSLMRWFRDYLYIPLGGNRVSTPRRYANVLVVFLVSGLWHGANWTFIVWGGLNGAYQVVHMATARPRRWLSERVRLPHTIATLLAVLLTFHLITVAWVFFRAPTIATAFGILERLGNALPRLPSLIGGYHWSGSFWLSLGLIAFLMIVEALDEVRPMAMRLFALPLALRWSCYYAVIFSILVIGVWSTGGFVYMKF